MLKINAFDRRTRCPFIRLQKLNSRANGRNCECFALICTFVERKGWKTIEKALKGLITTNGTISRSECQDDDQYRRAEKSRSRNVRAIFYSCHVDQCLAPWLFLSSRVQTASGCYASATDVSFCAITRACYDTRDMWTAAAPQTSSLLRHVFDESALSAGHICPLQMRKYCS